MPKVSFHVNYNDLLTMQGQTSKFNQYYQLDSPFGFVLETYSSSNDNCFINLASFTPNDIRLTTVTEEATIHASQNRCLHQHDYYEIMFVLDGVVTNTIENTSRTYTKGSGCLLNRNIRHAEKFNTDFRVFFLNLSKEYISKIVSAQNRFYFYEESKIFRNDLFQFLLNNQTEKFSNIKEYIDFLPVGTSNYGFNRIYEIGESIAKLMISPSYGSSYLVDGYITSILSILSDPDCFHTTTMRLDYGNDFSIFSNAAHMIEDAGGLISRDELSQKLLYSGDYINRVIKKYSGMNMSAYCMNIRMEHALELLKGSDLSISEISYRLGFKNRNYFYQHFKKKYGKSPIDIRKEDTTS